MSDRGRAAVVLDTGAVTRGSASKNEDRERNIRKWFVDNDLIDGVILLPENLFYNTTAAGIIIVFNKNKLIPRKGKIILVNASKRFKKGRPKNFLPDDAVRAIASQFIAGQPVEGETAIVDRERIADADYNLGPSRWVDGMTRGDAFDVSALLGELRAIADEERRLNDALFTTVSQLPRAE